MKLICRSVLMILMEFLHLIILHFNLVSKSQSFWWNKYRRYIILMHLHFTLYGNASKLHYTCMTWVFHSIVHEEYILLGYDAILISNLLHMSRRSLPLPSSKSAFTLIMEAGSSSITDYCWTCHHIPEDHNLHCSNQQWCPLQ